MGLSLFTRKQNGRATCSPRSARDREKSLYEPADQTVLETDQLRQLVQLERYGQIARHPERFSKHADFNGLHQTAVRAIDERFALVPEGFVSMPQTVNDVPGCPEVTAETEPFLLERHAVTNAQFQKFVDAGGYGELDLWPKDMWPHLIDFKDRTDEAGPRFWREGRHDKRLSEHPVVGICYYEAAAYAHWAGYRLPSESEWQMAASWRIRSSADVLRRYPWGDALDVDRCNIWASGIGTTTQADAYQAGAAPNGVLQLIGNVWEWNSSDFDVTDDDGRPIIGGMAMKSIRGGAFDTYFPAQATGCFRTGLSTLSRVQNVGFRSALEVGNGDSCQG